MQRSLNPIIRLGLELVQLEVLSSFGPLSASLQVVLSFSLRVRHPLRAWNLLPARWAAKMSRGARATDSSNSPGPWRRRTNRWSGPHGHGCGVAWVQGAARWQRERHGILFVLEIWFDLIWFFKLCDLQSVRVRRTVTLPYPISLFCTGALQCPSNYVNVHSTCTDLYLAYWAPLTWRAFL
jgi:hypothetical protein